jgi:hypothetical protein
MTATWKPIATAPKDGTLILIFIPDRKICPVQFGFFVDSVCIEHGKVKSEDKHWMTQEWPFFSSIKDPHPEPSHWMPLPSPPKIPIPVWTKRK